MAEEATAGYLAGRIDVVREHVVSLAAAAPKLGAEFGRIGEQLAQEWQTRTPGAVLGLIAACLLLGYAVEAAYRFWVKGSEIRDDSVRARLRSIGVRLARDLGGVAAFAAGSAAVVMVFDWPARTRQAVIGFLVALVVLWLVILVSRTLLSPRDARLRILPAGDAEAAFWHRRLALFAGWFAAGWVLVSWLALLGMDLAARQLVAYALGLGLLAIAAEAFWQRSRLMALYFLLLWLLWAAGAKGALWLAVVVAALPVVMSQVQRGADHVLRAAVASDADSSGLLAAGLGRSLRALAVIGAAYLLVFAFDLDVESLATGDTLWMRLLRGAVHALVIVLVADVLWRTAAALIDRSLVTVQSTDGVADEDEANRRARLRTLLPIVRGLVAVVLIVMAILMSLSALGIEVAPLLAGAGVVGVAVGFGAQTLVRDLFSKFFYLLDDAFRVGEYIQSGNYKGTVEHLGVRSVRLRHHRGPVYTIPYGQLGAVQNMARDWVIDKLTIGLTYDSDLDKARKLIKKIGQDLAKEPDFAPHILEPLKMQGVEQFGDFAIQVRMKMKTKPGQQFTIRRKAYAMIKAAFAENGIHFATPTVQVAGGGEAAAVSAAVARQALELGKAPAEKSGG